MHERRQQVALLGCGRHREIALAVQGIEDGAPGVERLVVAAQLQESGHPAHVGAQGFEVHPEGDVPVVGGSGQGQVLVELAVYAVRPGPEVACSRYRPRGAGGVRQVLAELGQPAGLARVVVQQPVGEVEQGFEAFVVQQPRVAQARFSCGACGKGQEFVRETGGGPVAGGRCHGLLRHA